MNPCHNHKRNFRDRNLFGECRMVYNSNEREADLIQPAVGTAPDEAAGQSGIAPEITEVSAPARGQVDALMHPELGRTLQELSAHIQTFLTLDSSVLATDTFINGYFSAITAALSTAHQQLRAMSVEAIDVVFAQKIATLLTQMEFVYRRGDGYGTDKDVENLLAEGRAVQQALVGMVNSTAYSDDIARIFVEQFRKCEIELHDRRMPIKRTLVVDASSGHKRAPWESRDSMLWRNKPLCGDISSYADMFSRFVLATEDSAIRRGILCSEYPKGMFEGHTLIRSREIGASVQGKLRDKDANARTRFIHTLVQEMPAEDNLTYAYFIRNLLHEERDFIGLLQIAEQCSPAQQKALMGDRIAADLQSQAAPRKVLGVPEDSAQKVKLRLGHGGAEKELPVSYYYSSNSVFLCAEALDHVGIDGAEKERLRGLLIPRVEQEGDMLVFFIGNERQENAYDVNKQAWSEAPSSGDALAYLYAVGASALLDDVKRKFTEGLFEKKDWYGGYKVAIGRNNMFVDKSGRDGSLKVQASSYPSPTSQDRAKVEDILLLAKAAEVYPELQEYVGFLGKLDFADLSKVRLRNVGIEYWFDNEATLNLATGIVSVSDKHKYYFDTHALGFLIALDHVIATESDMQRKEFLGTLRVKLLKNLPISLEPVSGK